MSSDRSIAQPAYVVAAALLLAGTAGAKDEVTSEAIKAEAVLQGTLPDAAQRKQRVVVVISGARTGSGLESLKRLSAIRKDLGCEELLLLANLLEGETKDAAAWCKANLPGLVVTRGLAVGRNTAARSRAFVFGQGGKLAYRGRPNEALTVAVRKALAQATPRFGAALKTAAVKKLAAQAESGRYGRVLKALTRHAQGDDLDAQVDARLLRERIERHGRRMLSSAEAAVPAGAVEQLKGISKAFGKQSPIGRQAADKRAALLKDPDFKKELKAGKLLGKLQKALAAVRPCARCAGGGGFSFEDERDEASASAAAGAGRLRCAGCRQQNRRLIGGLQAGFKKLARFGGTQAAARGKRLAAPLLAPTSGGGGGGIGFGSR